MITVGIIANPASGKDIRRLVAHGSVFDNDEKVSIVRRALLGMDAVGVERVLVMPDSFGICHKACDGVQLRLAIAPLSMPLLFSQEDSSRGAALMVADGAGCIITLGGDGTNRAVAKGCGDVPLMPISTGTNNVFPTMIEGTIAGLAAGLIARGVADGAVRQAPRLDVIRDEGARDDLALIDATVYDERFIAARAIWDIAKIKEIILTRAEPGSIGMSAIGAHLLGGDYPPDHGVYIRIGAGGRQVLAPFAPGMIQAVGCVEHRLLPPGAEVIIQHEQPCVLALDGEREIALRPEASIRLRLNPHGPRVVDARKAIELAARAGIFLCHETYSNRQND